MGSQWDLNAELTIPENRGTQTAIMIWAKNNILRQELVITQAGSTHSGGQMNGTY